METKQSNSPETEFSIDFDARLARFEAELTTAALFQDGDAADTLNAEMFRTQFEKGHTSDQMSILICLQDLLRALRNGNADRCEEAQDGLEYNKARRANCLAAI